MDLLAGLRGIPGVTVAAVEINLDADEIARAAAESIAEEVRANMLRGVAPDGGALPAPAEATVKRRGPGPRGQRTGRLVHSIRAVRVGPGVYEVGADEIAPGQLAKSLGDRRLWRARPSTETYRAALATMVTTK